MPNDYYSDGAESPPEAPEKESPESEDPGDTKTALLPKSILGGKEFDVGDEVVLEITALHEDEVEVKYAIGKEEKGESEEETPSMAKANQDNRSMASFMED